MTCSASEAMADDEQDHDRQIGGGALMEVSIRN